MSPPKHRSLLAKILLPKMHTESWILLCIAMLNAFSAIMGWKTRTDVATVKKATDGLTSALVDTTRKEALHEGQVQGRATEEAKAAVLALGREEARQEAEKKVTVVTEVAVKDPPKTKRTP